MIVYYLYLITFFCFPILGWTISSSKFGKQIDFYLKPILIFFAVHNFLFILGISLKGDFIDYLIFSLEYLLFCYLVFRNLKLKNLTSKLFSISGIIVMIFGFIQAFPGILLFIVISKDYEADRIFKFQNKYETRRYVYGFATTTYTTYTFDTYRISEFLPIEIKLDSTKFFDLETKLNISEKGLKFNVFEKEGKKYLEIFSTNSYKFLKEI